MSRDHCTGSRACWPGARTHSTSRGGSCASRPKTSVSPTPGPSPWRSPRRRPTISSAAPEATVYLATAPKSNRVCEAFSRAAEAAKQYPAEGVPLHIRNAPTPLMKELGYDAGYKYAHAHEHGFVPQEYL